MRQPIKKTKGSHKKVPGLNSALQKVNINYTAV